MQLSDFVGEGRCAETDPEIFFPDLAMQYIHAEKKVCLNCDVRDKCLQWALEQDANPEGIWGGTTEVERMKLRRKMKKAA